MTTPSPVLAFLGELAVYAVLGLGLALSLVILVRTATEWGLSDLIEQWRASAARAKQEASNER